MKYPKPKHPLAPATCLYFNPELGHWPKEDSENIPIAYLEKVISLNISH